MEYWFQGWKQARSCRQGYLIVKVEVYFVLPLMNHSIYAKQLVKGTLLSFFCIPPFLTHIYMSLFNEILPPPPQTKGCDNYALLHHGVNLRGYKNGEHVKMSMARKWVPSQHSRVSMYHHHCPQLQELPLLTLQFTLQEPYEHEDLGTGGSQPETQLNTSLLTQGKGLVGCSEDHTPSQFSTHTQEHYISPDTYLVSFT